MGSTNQGYALNSHSLDIQVPNLDKLINTDAELRQKEKWRYKR